jgi:hypothetical protein
LYDALRDADTGGPERIVVARPLEIGSGAERAVWRAVIERLRRASAEGGAL